MALLDGVQEYDDGSASNLAFKKAFRVSVQNKFLKTPEIIKLMGTPTTGNKRLDRQLQENFVEILATPIACVEYYLMGAPLKFRNAAIPNQILTILRQHLKNWDYILNFFHNVEPPPIDDLDSISEFCDLIMRYAAASGKKESAWLLTGRASKRIKTNLNLNTGVGSNRRKLPTGRVVKQEDVSEQARAEKLMNFRKNFNKVREETKC